MTTPPLTGSVAEQTLAVQLEQDRIRFIREYHFAPPRKWRADFAIARSMLLIEIDGGSWVRGRHVTGKGFEADLEKLNAAALLGYRVLRFTPAQVEDGRALAVIRQALGIEKAA
jgi:very-short-patch-repair endonuclease